MVTSPTVDMTLGTCDRYDLDARDNVGNVSTDHQRRAELLGHAQPARLTIPVCSVSGAAVGAGIWALRYAVAEHHQRRR